MEERPAVKRTSSVYITVNYIYEISSYMKIYVQGDSHRSFRTGLGNPRHDFSSVLTSAVPWGTDSLYPFTTRFRRHTPLTPTKATTSIARAKTTARPFLGR